MTDGEMAVACGRERRGEGGRLIRKAVISASPSALRPLGIRHVEMLATSEQA
jgi:hypothetical protein